MMEQILLKFKIENSKQIQNQKFKAMQENTNTVNNRSVLNF